MSQPVAPFSDWPREHLIRDLVIVRRMVAQERAIKERYMQALLEVIAKRCPAEQRGGSACSCIVEVRAIARTALRRKKPRAQESEG